MGVTKITKIYYQHNTEQGRWNYNIDVEDTLNGGNCKQITRLGGTVPGVGPDRMQLYFKFRNKANDTDIEVEGSPIKVFGEIAGDHTTTTTSTWAEGVLPFVVHNNISDAKIAMMHPDIIEAFNSDTDRQEFELVDSGKGLKHTFDWPIENDSTKDSKYTQFKDTYDSRWVPANEYVDGIKIGVVDSGTFLNVGCIQINSTAHIF